jgi:hypothetical protein
MTVARVLMFPDAIEQARLRLVEARLAWRRVQQAEATEENFEAYQETREAYVAAWVHYQAMMRL